MLASRPLPAVTRITNTRVLDRVGNGNALRNTPAATQASEANQVQDAPPIPSFLKLVKC
jgi:hypothetical protein